MQASGTGSHGSLLGFLKRRSLPIYSLFFQIMTAPWPNIQIYETIKAIVVQTTKVSSLLIPTTAPAQPGCQVWAKDVWSRLMRSGLMEHALWMLQNQKPFYCTSPRGFIPNTDRWVNRMKTSSLNPQVRANAMCTQEAGLINNSE